jgi:hypothetical protein
MDATQPLANAEREEEDRPSERELLLSQSKDKISVQLFRIYIFLTTLEKIKAVSSLKALITKN